jgi:transcriptional regulator with XRE-family HTH domain
MNIGQTGEQDIDPAVWERPQMRRALATRDMATVYALLQRIGISQRQIAARTAQSQSEISEIRSGRQVMAYEVLSRIADGLGIPRGYMGLAYDPATARLARPAGGDGHDAHEAPEVPAVHDGGDGLDDGEQARRLLAHAAQVTIGAVTGDPRQWAEPLPVVETPAPHRIGAIDVEQVEAVTHALRALDYRHGGGVCRDAVVAQLAWSQRLLHATCTDEVALRLHRALADQHNLAGWTSFDVGLYGPARAHLARALEQAEHARDASLAANVLYRMGRVHLHYGRLRPALRFFQLGQISARDAGCERSAALLGANEAWAYALLGDTPLALRSMARARDEFARSRGRDSPAWVSFFGPADLDALGGMVHAALGDGHLDVAAELLTGALAAREPDMRRSRAFELTALATVQLRAGERDGGLDTGHQAVTLATMIRSARIVDRLAPLQAAAAACRRGGGTDSAARELAQRISAVRAA